jgi:hypothetical protein
LHVYPLHELFAHVAVAFAGALHAFEQLPQCSGLLVSSTQVLPQRSGVGDVHPVTHA